MPKLHNEKKESQTVFLRMAGKLTQEIPQNFLVELRPHRTLVVMGFLQ